MQLNPWLLQKSTCHRYTEAGNYSFLPKVPLSLWNRFSQTVDSGHDSGHGWVILGEVENPRTITLSKAILEIKQDLMSRIREQNAYWNVFWYWIRIHEITILLFRIQEARWFGSVSPGRGIDPSMKPTLFFTDKAIVIAHSMKLNYHQWAIDIQGRDQGYPNDEGRKDWEDLWWWIYHVVTL